MVADGQDSNDRHQAPPAQTPDTGRTPLTHPPACTHGLCAPRMTAATGEAPSLRRWRSQRIPNLTPVTSAGPPTGVPAVCESNPICCPLGGERGHVGAQLRGDGSACWLVATLGAPGAGRHCHGGRYDAGLAGWGADVAMSRSRKWRVALVVSRARVARPTGTG